MAVLSLILAAIAVIADQLIKRLVVLYLKPVGSLEVFPGFLDFTYVENRGAAFGILQNQRWFFIVMTALLSIMVIYLLFRYQKHEFFSIAACTLVLGGGIGNLIDRIFQSFVVDYIHFSFFPPVFNFADCCVTIGMLCMLIHIFFFSEKEENVEKVA